MGRAEEITGGNRRPDNKRIPDAANRWRVQAPNHAIQATGLISTVEGEAGLTLTLHKVEARQRGWCFPSDPHSDPVGLGGLWVVFTTAPDTATGPTRR
jgi:hypothetical protein